SVQTTLTTEIYPLSLHDALPISRSRSETTSEHAPTVARHRDDPGPLLALRDVQPELRFEASRTETRNAHVGIPLVRRTPRHYQRSEEHTSELQSREKLVCRLLLE